MLKQIIRAIEGITAAKRIPVSRALRMNTTVNDARKYEIDWMNSSTFSDVPSWMVCMSAIKSFVI